MRGRKMCPPSLLGQTAGCLLLSLCAAGPALARPAPAARLANKGLPTGFAAPSWAANRRVHLLPTRSPLPRRSGLSPLAGSLPRGGLQGATEPPYEGPNIANTDRPARYHEAGYGVQHDPHVHVIFWGGGWNEGPGPALRTQLLNMYKGLSGSSFQGVLTQYFDSSGRVSPTVTVESYTDIDAQSPSPTAVNDAKIRAEVSEALKANKTWARELSSQFVVIPAPGATYEPGFARFCGYHGLIEESTPSAAYTYTFVPDVEEEPFHSPCIEYDESENPNHVTSMIAAHEYAESATDPGVDTWFTEEGFEIADLCAFRDREASEGSLKGAWVQGLWDDHRSACSIADAEPPHVYAVTEEGSTSALREVDLSGVVGPEGLETKYRFEYGPTPSYGTSVPISDAEVGPSGGVLSMVEATVEGLAEGIYHYRLVATNGSGTTYGEDRIAMSPGFAAQTLPVPPESSEEHEAEGLSCVAPETCVAVGSYFNVNRQSHLTLAEMLAGGEWAVQPTPSPSGASESVLRGVSCASASACTAVGFYKSAGDGQLSLAERWNGSDWSIQSIPNPSGTTESELRSVACRSPSECTAVGYYASSTGARRTLAERWDGSEWSVQPTPDMNGVGNDQLLGVSCSAPTVCVAVGYGGAPRETDFALAERWDGSEWALQPIGTSEQILSGVSCNSPSACMAVGVGGSGTAKALAERWDGSQWESSTAYESLDGSNLNTVACVSPTYCVAAGQYYNPASPTENTEVLAVTWNGVGWMQAAMPGLPRSPGSWRENWLQALSCTEARACVGVGDTLTAEFGERAYQVGIAELEIGPPTATTESASGVAYNEATVAGTVNPAGLDTHYHFEYGPTNAYGSSTPTQDATSGGGRVDVSAFITGLPAGAPAHYRLVATNAAGTSYGEDGTFTTVAPPPGPPPPPSPGETGGTPTSPAPLPPQVGSGGSGTQAGGSGSGGQIGDARAHATVGADVSVHGDAVLVRLSCHGHAGSSCVVLFTLTVNEKLEHGIGRRAVVVGRKTTRLRAGASETVRMVLAASWRRLLRVRRGVLAARQIVSQDGATVSSQAVRFRAP